MSMEMTFIVTWSGAILAGALLAILTYWIFEKDNEEADKNGET